MTDSHWPKPSIETDAGLRLAMLADDVSGGCDAGVQFSRRGAPTRVYLRFPQIFAAHERVSVLVTHSRNDSPEEANRKVQLACDQIALSGAVLCYKKIDSTLKGNLGAELDAVQSRYPDRLILLCPSFPNMRRILVDAWLRVSCGSISESTELLSRLTSQGARNLAHISQPAEKGKSPTLREQILLAEAAGARIIVIDAATETHLDAIAEAAFQIVPQPLLVGSAGLASAWSELLLRAAHHSASGASGQADLEASAVSSAVDKPGPVVFFIGSANPVTWQQARHLEGTQRARNFDCRRDDVNQAQAALADGCHLIFSLQAVAINLGELRRVLAAILETRTVRGLVCSGGETALQVCSALEAEAIQLRSEILPGLPWGTLVGGSACCLPICTKAGGFGSIEALCRAADFLATKSPFRG